MNIFTNDIYYFPEEEVILIYKIEGDIINIYDIISKKDVQKDDILKIFTTYQIKNIVFYFTPEYKNINYNIKEFEANDILFIKTRLDLMPDRFKYPITAQA